MSEPPMDVYVDQFVVTPGPYGAALSFSRNAAHPAGLTPAAPEPVITLRLSVEHLKVLSFLIRRQVKRLEEVHGVVYPVPRNTLAASDIPAEDWEFFWKG